MSRFPKPEVGDELFLVETGNRARHGRGRQYPCTVVKVGRKYFTVEYKSSPESQYTNTVELRLENFVEKTEYSPEFRAYLKEQDWLDETRRSKWISTLRRYFDYLGGGPEATLEQLEKVAEILGVEIDEE